MSNPFNVRKTTEEVIEEAAAPAPEAVEAEAKPKARRKPASVMERKDNGEASENFKKPKLVGMTFNMPVEWHHQFKMEATSRRMSMHEFLYEVYGAWEREQRALKGK